MDIHPIGVIHTPLLNKEGPIQSARSLLSGTAEIFPQFTDALTGLDGFSHIFLLYTFHQVTGKVKMMVKPFLDDKLQGLFSTRSPNRPNPIGLSIVKVLDIDEGKIVFLGADMLNGSPLLDIKPYIPDFDCFPSARCGWFECRKIK